MKHDAPVAPYLGTSCSELHGTFRWSADQFGVGAPRSNLCEPDSEERMPAGQDCCTGSWRLAPHGAIATTRSALISRSGYVHIRWRPKACPRAACMLARAARAPPCSNMSTLSASRNGMRRLPPRLNPARRSAILNPSAARATALLRLCRTTVSHIGCAATWVPPWVPPPATPLFARAL